MTFNFSDQLLEWYDLNKRDLPWRGLTDPYPVWLSEVILQQTRVEQGISYYLKFMKLFPSVRHLADASEDEVLKAWQGLGYYSRARNLRATAQQIVADYQGQFPDSAEELKKLKGIGPYTSAAIASFCFSERVAVMDGNVMRVLTRLFGITQPIDSSDGRKQLEIIAADLIPEQRSGDFNQAIMEFGALHCTPSQPKCGTCPFAGSCVALENDLVSELPIKAKKTQVKNIWLYYFFVTHKNFTYIRRRSEKGIWYGLYDFPNLQQETVAKEKKVIQQFLGEHSLTEIATVQAISDEFIHVLSHRKISARFVTINLQTKWEKLPDGMLRVDAESLHTYGMSRLMEKFLQTLQ